jgi:hypothetical protein
MPFFEVKATCVKSERLESSEVRASTSVFNSVAVI